MATERKKGAKSAARTELVAIRFDPETKYMMEIAARVQRRSIANYVEWAVEESLKSVVAYEDETTKETVADLRRQLWDPIESDRFAILASYFPHLLTHEEQKLWRLIEDVWSIVSPLKDLSEPMKGFRIPQKDLKLLRLNWEIFNNAAQDETPPQIVAQAVTWIDTFEGDIQSLASTLRAIGDPAEIVRLKAGAEKLRKAREIQQSLDKGSKRIKKIDAQG